MISALPEETVQCVDGLTLGIDVLVSGLLVRRSARNWYWKSPCDEVVAESVTLFALNKPTSGLQYEQQFLIL